MAVQETNRKAGRPPNEQIRTRREEEILDAAARLFAEHGYSETATEAVAQATGVGKGTIYRYFPTKRDLFLAAVDRTMRQLKRRVDDAILPYEDPIDAMRVGIQAYLAFFAEQPQVVELFIQERAQFKDRKTHTYFEHREANKQRWRDVFAELIERGRVRRVPVHRILDVIGDLLYGTMFTNYFAARQRPPAEQARDVADIILHGVLSDSERKRREAATDDAARAVGDSGGDGQTATQQEPAPT